ncbi:MAG: Der GTPase-activating protein YihI [Aestuariibacter sp.]
MARQKKSRKVGPIGVKKDATKPKVKSQDSRKKKHTGKRPGSRNSELLKKVSSSSGSQTMDKRLGSKKPIPLLSEPANKRFKSPQEELEHIESDPVLQALLDRQEAEQSLSAKEQHKLNEMLARHQLLCELLGIDDDLEDDESL